MSHSDDAPDAGKVAAAGEAWKLPKLALARARARVSPRNATNAVTLHAGWDEADWGEADWAKLHLAASATNDLL
jgi:hypothetical protein